MTSNDRYFDSAIAYYVDASLPPLTPLGSSLLSQKAKQQEQQPQPQPQQDHHHRHQQPHFSGVAVTVGPGLSSGINTPLSSTRGGARSTEESMFFPNDNFGEGILSPVASGVTPRGLTPHASVGNGFHGFGLQLPPTPQGHPGAFSRSTTPLISPSQHFKFHPDPTPTNSGNILEESIKIQGKAAATPFAPAPASDAVASTSTSINTKAAAASGNAAFLAAGPSNSNISDEGEISTSSCVPHNPTSQATGKCYQGHDFEEMMNTEVPDFRQIVNFPTHVIQPGRKRKLSKNVGKDGKPLAKQAAKRRCCVMCGKACSSKSVSKYGDENSSKPSDHEVTIPAQNKGLCTACDVTIWVHTKTNMQIKWCKGCKNFKTWAAFGRKGHLTKCGRCRDEQNKRYARQKQIATSTKRSREE